MEMSPESRSAAEVVGLWAYVSDRLARLRGEAAVPVAPAETAQVHVLAPVRPSGPLRPGFGRRADGPRA